MAECMETFKVTHYQLHTLNAHHTELQDKVRELEEKLALVADGANAVVNVLAEAQETRVSSEWSDWQLVGDEAPQDIKQRVEELEAGSGSGPVEYSDDWKLEIRNLAK